MEAKCFRVYGKVQGVFFRKYTYQEAGRLGISGWIRNDESGEFVEGCCQGTADQLRQFERFLHAGPKKARVDRVELSQCQQAFRGFEIRK